MEKESPLPCPHTVTVRRNPHRRARPTPSTNAPPIPYSSFPLKDIPSFPMEDILSMEVPSENPQPSTSSGDAGASENLRVFLRIRPLKPLNGPGKFGRNLLRPKNVWPQNPSKKNNGNEKNKKKKEEEKKCEICITVNDSRSVTLSPPSALQDVKRIKSEVYEGFSHVFSADSSQNEVYETMVNPLVEDFLGGKSGMLAALGPSGSGKTHTVFGSPRDPGMVPLVLGRIFKQTEGSSTESSRSFYISMFEIYSERGKGERVLDLSPDGGDVSMQSSTMKGLQEVIISDVAQAESIIARGMLKRATAMTNSNSQSSRSQCIINIRCALKEFDGGADVQSNNAVLTIVDLAGAEREKKTGNQGARLRESNFINNTSMVFGLCLRSLLEHQKNPKKPLQKHFQNSLLTRYLRHYLEGKKRMALILTVKSGEDDYLDTSFLLRQASPYMKIRFNNVEEPSSLLCNKRQIQILPRSEESKRIKLSSPDACATKEGNSTGNGHQLLEEEIFAKKIKEIEPVKVLGQSPEVFKLNVDDSRPSKLDGFDLAERERNARIMQDFAKALWNVLKEYKNKLEVAENVIHSLRDSLNTEKTRSFVLEKELKDLKFCCSCSKEISVEAALVGVDTNSESRVDSSSELKGHASNVHERNVDIRSPNLDASEYNSTLEKCDSPVGLIQDALVQRNVDIRSPNLDASEYNSTLEKCGSPVGQIQDALVQRNVDICSPNLDASEYNSTLEKCDSPVGQIQDALVQRNGDSCSPNLDASEYNSTLEKCDSPVGQVQDALVQRNGDSRSPNLDASEYNSTLEKCDSLVGQIQDALVQRNVDIHSPNLDASEYNSTMEKCDFPVGQIQDALMQRNVDIRSPNLNASECNSILEKCDSPIGQIQDALVQIENSNVIDPNPPCIKDFRQQNYQVIKGAASSNLMEFRCHHNEQKPDAIGRSPDMVNASCLCGEDFNKHNNQCTNQKRESFPGNGNYAEDLNELRYLGIEDSCPSTDETGSRLSELVVSSSQPLVMVRDDNCSSLEPEHSEGDENLLDPPLPLKENEAVTQGCHVGNVPESDAAEQKPLKAEKPKRRLLPASSILLRDISGLDFEDENEKPKGIKGEKKLAADEGKMTQGSISLLHLLRNNLHL